MTQTILEEIEDILGMMLFYMESNITKDTEDVEKHLNDAHLDLQAYVYTEHEDYYAKYMFIDWIVDGFARYVGLFVYAWINDAFEYTNNHGIKFYFHQQTKILYELVKDPNKADELIKELSYSLAKLREITTTVLEHNNKNVH